MRLTKAEIKYARSLAQKKVREKEGKFILEGWKPLSDAIDANAEIEYVATDEQNAFVPEQAQIIQRAEEKGIKIRHATALELRQVADTMQTQGMFAILLQKKGNIEAVFQSRARFIVVCDDINDPGNLGSIVRSCDWFGVDALVLGIGCVSLHNEKVIRATAGSVFHLEIIEDVDLLHVLPRLKAEGYTVVATAMDGTMNPHELRTIDRLALILGSEAHGIRHEVRALADVVAAIPNFGRAESLNVGVACGVFLAARTLKQSP